jgi:hypothetical protein
VNAHPHDRALLSAANPCDWLVRPPGARRPSSKVELESFVPTEREILGRRLGKDSNDLVEDLLAESGST